MNKQYQKLILVLITIFITNCDELYNFEDTDLFYIENDEAYMPVRISGNKDSNVFILLLHGGPGGTAQPFAGSPVEEDYAYIYWDQRAAGSSHGNSGTEYFTLEQYIEDMDIVIQAVNIKYDNPLIFLHGQSWGGLLGTAYLLDETRQSKITGWIEEAGGHDMETGMELSRQFVIDYAETQIQLGSDDSSDWLDVIDWYDENPTIDVDNVMQHVGYVGDSYGYTPEDADLFISDEEMFSIMFFSNYNYITVQLNSLYSQSYFNILDINYVPEMYKITIPSLILWGEHDGILPVPLAQQAYDALGTPDEDKYITILPNSGHGSVEEDFDLYNRTIIDFVDKYK